MATLAQPAECVLTLPAAWVDAAKFERALWLCGDALGGPCTGVVVQVPAGCKPMVEVIVRLLSFCNQACLMTKRVRLQFADDDQAAMGYLDRMGFFDHLSPSVEVSPSRPAVSGARLHRGGNSGLVEIARFSGTEPAEDSLVVRLAETARNSCSGRPDVAALHNAVFTILCELIGNVVEHSGSPLDAFAVLQTYPRGNKVRIAVSDSGFGVLETLRPALRKKGDPMAVLGDVDLLVEMFRKGVSRYDDDNRGTGLMACAAHAIRFKADLDVRLLRGRVLLKPAETEYQPNMAYLQVGLPLMWGTHIAFTLNLA
ncbi:hypothetical protein [Altererythrobacter sp. Root672]|uniref:hypothetical protein n=1 Tax=Altererythrobacter sp. Root672 TaxID=1736584 RepID=UPI000AD086F7|nr:hypothetical protein [Altererythrobacter sp. Root672]